MEPVTTTLADCLSGMCGSIPRELFPSTVFDDLHRVCVGTDRNANHLYPTPFHDADVNAFKQGNFVQCRCMPLRKQGYRFARVNGDTDAGQLSLEERHNLHSVRCEIDHLGVDAV